VWERFVTAIKIDIIPLFVRCWVFDVHSFLLLIELAAFQASGGTGT
jgi:hypothetical protein